MGLIQDFGSKPLQSLLAQIGAVKSANLYGVPTGVEAILLALLAQENQPHNAPILFIARDDVRQAELSEWLRWFAPELLQVSFVAWDCLPYDRVSPQKERSVARLDALRQIQSALCETPGTEVTEGTQAASKTSKNPPQTRPIVVIATVAAMLQRVIARHDLAPNLRLEVGSKIEINALVEKLIGFLFRRTSTVREAGEFAVRGGLVDVFAAGTEAPIRIDFFGETIESLKYFDAATQLTTHLATGLEIGTVSEIALNRGAIERFRSGYRAAFTAELQGDPLYESISSGQAYPGMEHWLPLFHDRLETLFDYLFPTDATVKANAGAGARESAGEGQGVVEGPDTDGEAMGARGVIASTSTSTTANPNSNVRANPRRKSSGWVLLDRDCDAAALARLEQINEYYQARQSIIQQRKVPRNYGGGNGANANNAEIDSENNSLYRPLPPERLYLTAREWQERLESLKVLRLHNFPMPDAVPQDQASHFDLGGRSAHNFAETRADPSLNLYDQIAAYCTAQIAAQQRLVIAADSEGSCERIGGVLGQHGFTSVQTVATWQELQKLPMAVVAMVVLPFDHGFTIGNLQILAETDLLGERHARRPLRRRVKDFLQDLNSLNDGDLVVHIDHGIGRYNGLVTLQIGDAPHDCLRVLYQGGDKLFVPVENLELLSRFGGEESEITLDKLGGAGWINRKARIKQRIRDLADKLMQIAALRAIRSTEVITPPEGLYDEFIAGFPFVETEDQARAIDDVLEDLASGKPMDRLICGDVGFGKSEVAMRAAMVVAMSGKQVAIAVPTTLLARQHFRTFSDRFAGLPLKLRQLSRLVTPREANETRESLKSGDIDIVIGTHALLAKSIEFKRLGLMVVDEEQHFGVAQKERLKEIAATLHLLTLSATPIPRTLHMALAGVRDMSLMATPPIDRLAVRTFVLPYDAVIIREAILREKYRGGQIFYVCPRIEDLTGIAERLRELVPEIKFLMAHGKMGAQEIESTMVAFCDGKFDLLLSTQIIESGLDIPNANTMIIHRADRFGLSQLYQLRGRIGRAKQRGYAYLTVPSGVQLAVPAQRRLEVMQTLDQLGAGFQVASHDLDHRGAGNLLGEEQSGQVREVGVELYQQLLEEAVTAARNAGLDRNLAMAGATGASGGLDWSPQLSLGISVLIPNDYVADLSIRLSLYRRLASLHQLSEVADFKSEMIDRFGKLPSEFANLLKIIELKSICRSAGIEKIDVGPKGAVISFYQNKPPNVEKLVEFLRKNPVILKLRPDQKLVYNIEFANDAARVQGVEQIATQLASLSA